jgi:hypothetical protein
MDVFERISAYPASRIQELLLDLWLVMRQAKEEPNALSVAQ